MQDNNSSNTTTPTKRKTGAASGQYENPWVQPAVNKVDSWFDSVLGAKAGSVLPQNTRQALQQNNGLLGSRLVRWCLALYIGFSLLLTSFHVTSWIFKSENSWKYERTYDADKSYSALDSMTHGLKMSKMLSKADYKTVDKVVPFWQKSSLIPDELDVTLITIVSPETWNEFTTMVESWKGPVSAILNIPKQSHKSVYTQIETDYANNPSLYENVDLHLAELPKSISSVLLPGNAERNLARIYAQTKHVLDGLTNIEFTTDLRSTLIKNRVKYADLLEQGDMLVVPTFQPTVTIDAASYPKTKKDVLNMIKNNQMALYDAYFDLNQGPTDLEAWEKAASPYVVKNYVMQYEPIVIQSKTVQPWCSERFVDRRSACLLESYFGGNDFIVLDHDFAIHKESNAKQRVSDLDSVIEKRLYAKFYWEQCVYQGRQLDALDLWNSKKSEHIREQCSRVIQNWGRGLIGKPE